MADEVDALYGLPLERFVPERDALAKRLRAERRRDDAAAVAKLGKPGVAAWVVNQLVRTQGATVRSLWEAGDALLAAQAALLDGSGGPDGLREASRAEQAALTPLLQAARGLLDARGRGPTAATLEKVGETLHAAALDPAHREEVAAGRLERELTPSGMEALSAAAAPAPARLQEGAAEATGRDRLVAAMEASIAHEREETAARAGGAGAEGGGDDERAAAEERERAVTEERERAEADARERAARETREREEAEAREREAAEAREQEAAEERGRQTAPEPEPAVAAADPLLAAERELGAAVRAREEAATEVERAIAALEDAREALREARRRERLAAQAVARLEDDA